MAPPPYHLTLEIWLTNPVFTAIIDDLYISDIQKIAMCTKFMHYQKTHTVVVQDVRKLVAIVLEDIRVSKASKKLSRQIDKVIKDYLKAKTTHPTANKPIRPELVTEEDEN